MIQDALLILAGAIATLSVFASVVKDMQDVKNIVLRSGFGIS